MYKDPQDRGRIYIRRLKIFFEEEYKEEASTKTEERKEERRKEKEEKKVEEKKDEEEKIGEEESKDEDKGGDEQQDQSVQDTQLPPPSPPHSTITPIEIIKIKDVVDTSSQNINPLTTEDLTKILDQRTL